MLIALSDDNNKVNDFFNFEQGEKRFDVTTIFFFNFQFVWYKE